MAVGASAMAQAIYPVPSEQLLIPDTQLGLFQRIVLCLRMMSAKASWLLGPRPVPGDGVMGDR